ATWLLPSSVLGAGDERHHAAQALARAADEVRLGVAAPGGQARLAREVLGEELLRELAALDLGQHAAHLGARLVGDDARAGAVVAVLGGVAHRPAHALEAALVDEVDD